MAEGTCHCGAPECWDEGDYSWLGSRSGWHGKLHGTDASVFFIHGKKIREQRHIPETHGMPVEEFARKLREWSSGLPEPIVMWTRDSGGGDADLWIEGVREPNDADRHRLEEVKQREDAENRRQYERLRKSFGESASSTQEKS